MSDYIELELVLPVTVRVDSEGKIDIDLESLQEIILSSVLDIDDEMNELSHSDLLH